MDDEPDTRELTAEQRARAQREEQLAEKAEENEEFAQHARRADKSRYLQKKLEEREQSERES